MIIGGTRGGKSHLARELAPNLDAPVLFVATAEAGDKEMKRHREKSVKTVIF